MKVCSLSEHIFSLPLTHVQVHHHPLVPSHQKELLWYSHMRLIKRSYKGARRVSVPQPNMHLNLTIMIHVWKHHPSTWETRALKHQMFWLYSWPPASAVFTHDEGSVVTLRAPPLPTLAIKEGCCSTLNQPHSDVSTCLSSHLTTFRWFPGVCVTALPFVNHLCSEITVAMASLTRLSDLRIPPPHPPPTAAFWILCSRL